MRVLREGHHSIASGARSNTSAGSIRREAHLPDSNPRYQKVPRAPLVGGPVHAIASATKAWHLVRMAWREGGSGVGWRDGIGGAQQRASAAEGAEIIAMGNGAENRPRR